MDDEKRSSGFNRELLEFFSRPESYPHKTGRVTHIQTHISHVFIAGSFVYKIKKPVSFEFLDYSTLEKRQYFCRREIELNRRLCEDIYLEVVPVYRGEEGYRFVPGEGFAVAEYAVKMKKLPEEYFLHNYLEKDALDSEHLDRVVGKLSRFYLDQDRDEEILKFGRIENIKVNTDENFRQTEPFIGETIEAPAYRAIKKFTNRYYERHADLFRRRVKERRIVDGHGDLHLEHIHITPEKVRIYDCIEFNERFRYGDLAGDLAYLAMDLDFNGCRKEERYFMERMAERLDDRGLLQIVDFYKCYRAYVKGKVKSLQSVEAEVSKEDRRRASETAARYFSLSLKYALLGSGPAAAVFMGQVGTGKSTLAGHLSRKLNIGHYSSDQVRKTMAGIPLERRMPADRRKSLYSSNMTDKTYRELRKIAAEELENGRSVILDATYSGPRRREKLKKMLEGRKVSYLFIETRAPDKTIYNRLKKREEENNVISDARAEDFEKLRWIFRSPGEIDSDHLVQIDTDRSLQETVEELYGEMIEKNLERVE